MPYSGSPSCQPRPWLSSYTLDHISHVNAEGLIDEVAIFSVELAQDDIRQIMELGLTGALGVDPRGKTATTWANIRAAR